MTSKDGADLRLLGFLRSESAQRYMHDTYAASVGMGEAFVDQRGSNIESADLDYGEVGRYLSLLWHSIVT